MESRPDPIGSNIRKHRELRHWTQEELALASGVDVRTVQRAESGRPLALESLKAIAAAFDTTVEALSASPATTADSRRAAPSEVLSVHAKPSRRPSAGPGSRHRDPRPQGPGACRV